MKRLALLGLVVVVACQTDARFATLHETEQPFGDSERTEYSTLASGMRLAVLRDPRSALTSIDLRLDVGVADDAKPGLALLVGELLAARGSDAELTTELDVDLDRTDIAVTAFDVDRALEAAARRLAPTCDDFDPYAVDAARERAVAALTGVSPTLAAAVWGSNHPYAHGLGDPKALAALTPDDACAFFKAHYGPASATIVVAGALDANFEQRFGRLMKRLPVTELAPRRAIAPLEPGVARASVWGLAKPTAALAFPVPARDAGDDAVAELVLREALAWDPDIHAALLGGRRGRVLLVALEGERASELPKLRDKLRSFITMENARDPDRARTTPEDSLDAAQELDDAFRRGTDVADLLVTGRPLDRLSRIRAWLKDSERVNRWLDKDLLIVKPRELELVPAAPGGGASIEGLADPASAADRDLSAATSPLTAIPVRAAPRPTLDYKLPSGLRVVLAPDARSPIVDVRLIVPVGRRDEREPGIATRAAVELEGADRASWSESDKIRWYGSRESIQDATVTPDDTQFRVVGFAGVAEWHVWALAYRLATGRFEHSTGALVRWKAHYVPAGATLIVSGGFDPIAIHRVIDTWLGPWRPIDREPVARARGPVRPAVELVDDGSLAIELGYAFPDGAKTPPATAVVLAALVQQRLGGALRGMMDATLAFDAGERRFSIGGAVDPGAVMPAIAMIEHELARLRTEPVSPRELERARRAAIASRLGGALGASGRARLLVERVRAGVPIDAPETIVADTAALTAEDLRAAAAELFVRANRDVAVHAADPLADHVLAALGIDPSTAARY